MEPDIVFTHLYRSERLIVQQAGNFGAPDTISLLEDQLASSLNEPAAARIIHTNPFHPNRLVEFSSELRYLFRLDKGARAWVFSQVLHCCEEDSTSDGSSEILNEKKKTSANLTSQDSPPSM